MTEVACQAQDGAKNVKVGSVIAVIAEEGDDLSAAADFAKDAPSPPKQEKSKDAPSPPAPKEDTAPPPQPSSEQRKADIPSGDRIFASPIAKKIALERGIPLRDVKGSGPDGRIVREDVEKFKPSSSSSAPAAQPALVDSPDYVDVPVSNMRRTIGNRLTQSKQELPHYYLTADINMDKVLKLREVFNRTLVEKDNSAKLSVNDFIVKAVACALADVPEANSVWLGEVIRTYASLTLFISLLLSSPPFVGTRKLISLWRLPLRPV
jgi:pyruvate dehydrogenase E2 component (dihydrolipoamide acetyltransferase)